MSARGPIPPDGWHRLFHSDGAASAGRGDKEDRLFIAWMRHAMASRRLTQRQVAMLAGIDHSTISRLVKGERTGLKYATALRLYRALENETTTPLLERSFSRDDILRGSTTRARPSSAGATRLQ
jgi:transcriptional regulator with XRE-family HTH domain